MSITESMRESFDRRRMYTQYFKRGWTVEDRVTRRLTKYLVIEYEAKDWIADAPDRWLTVQTFIPTKRVRTSNGTFEIVTLMRNVEPRLRDALQKRGISVETVAIHSQQGSTHYPFYELVELRAKID